jgi:hypothetical protein
MRLARYRAFRGQIKSYLAFAAARFAQQDDMFFFPPKARSNGSCHIARPINM